MYIPPISPASVLEQTPDLILSIIISRSIFKRWRHDHNAIIRLLAFNTNHRRLFNFQSPLIHPNAFILQTRVWATITTCYADQGMDAHDTQRLLLLLFSCSVMSDPFVTPRGFSDSSAGKESACNAGDLGLIPGLGRSPGEGKGYPLQYSGLENSMGLQRVRHDWVAFTFTFILVGMWHYLIVVLIWFFLMTDTDAFSYVS